MKTSVTEPSSTERVLEIEVERQRFDKIFDDKVKKYSKEIRINGFRPGNVPKQVVTQRFGGPLRAETLETLVEEVLKEACKEKGIEPVGPGRIEKLESEEGKPIVVKAVLEVDPPLVLKDYKLDIPVHPAEIPDAEVENQLQILRKRKSEENKVERPAAAGDVVVAQYLRIAIEGEERPLPPRPEFRVEIGAGGIAEMDAALTGSSAGEEKDVAFSFPDDYRNPELAGKRSEYRLRIIEVDEVTLPELDDAFAKDFGFESLAAFRERIKTDLGKQALQRAKEEAYEQALGRLIEANPFDIPKARINNYVNYKLDQMGHKHEPGEDHGHDHSDLEEEAVYNIRRYRILEEIAKVEKIKATTEEVDARVRELAEQYGTDFETLKASLRKNGKIIDVREEIKSEKTLDFVIGFNREASAG
ncbi:MAG TPA: trigger factor [Fibrobacteria bacterium]|nr:trigger factor [Fibrobacteria bacterium]